MNTGSYLKELNDLLNLHCNRQKQLNRDNPCRKCTLDDCRCWSIEQVFDAEGNLARCDQE